MAAFFPSITAEQAALIQRAPLFFIASADPDLAPTPGHGGPVNVSPRGGVPLHILGPNHVAFLDYKGSGNETAQHALRGGPITVMVCSFEAEDAAIVRLYGRATVTPVAESPLAAELLVQGAAELQRAAPPGDRGARGADNDQLWLRRAGHGDRARAPHRGSRAALQIAAVSRSRARGSAGAPCVRAAAGAE